MSDVVTAPVPWFRRSLSALGIILVGWDSTSRLVRGETALWASVAVAVALLGWILFVLLPSRARRSVATCLAVMVIGGGIAATDTDGVAIVPIIVAVVWLARDPRRSLGYPLGAGLLGIVLIVAGDVLRPLPPLAVLSMAAGVVVAFFGGVSRRQLTVADARSRALVEEQARADVLVSRQQIAHDIHDVLAHSLGGLVIQLDAVDALLEAGDSGSMAAAAARVRDARVLAAEGLGEARRAVAALGDSVADAAPVGGDQLHESLAALLTAHRSLGGIVDFDETGRRREVSAELATALRRALQEALTNARKHAPAESVAVRLAWKSGTVALTVSNPIALPGDLAASTVSAAGGGHGLLGMRDRFAKLAGGSATAAAEDGSFVVRVAGETA